MVVIIYIEILNVFKPSEMIKLYDKDGNRIYFRSSCKEYVDEIYDNYNDLTEFEVFIKIHQYMFHLKFKLSYDAFEKFRKKLIGLKNKGKALPRFDINAFKMPHDWDGIMPAKIIVCRRMILSLNTRSISYQSRGQLKATVQAASYTFDTDHVTGTGCLINKVIPKISQQQIRDQYATHPSYVAVKQRYSIDTDSLQIFEQAMTQQINVKITEIRRLYRR